MNGLKRGARILTGFAAAALVFGLSGCLENPVDSDDVSVELYEIGEVEAASGSETPVTGTIESSPAISGFEYEIIDESGNEVDRSLISLTYTSFMGLEDVDLEEDADMRIDAADNATNGTYTLKLSITAGSETSTKRGDFTVVGGSSQQDSSAYTSFSNVTIEVAAGSGDNANNCASFDGSTFTYNEGADDMELQVACDFVYYYTDTAVISAPSAVSSDINNGYDDWTQLNETKIKEATSPDWDNAQSGDGSAVASAAEGASATQAIGLSIGDVYAFVTDSGGKAGLFKVTDLDPGYGSDKYITIDIIVEE
ncbi:MAG: hypothetical protein ACOCSE_05770 [Chitinivibrionales bacterium]